MSFCHNLWFSNPNIFATQCRIPKIFPTMNSVKSNKLSLKYKRFTPSGCKDIGIIKSEFAVKTHFLFMNVFKISSKDFKWNSFLVLTEHSGKNSCYLFPKLYSWRTHVICIQLDVFNFLFSFPTEELFTKRKSGV